MNMLEHYIVEILEKRPLNEKESSWAKAAGRDPEDYIYVKWIYNCYGAKQTTDGYYVKSDWEKIEINGYAWMQVII